MVARLNNPVTDISVLYNIALITVDNLPNNSGMVSEVFHSIAENGINIDMISLTPPFKGSVSISFSMPADDIVKAIGSLNKLKNKLPELRVEVDTDNSKMTVSGENMKNLSGVAARLFTILAETGVEIKLVTTSETDISFLLYDKDIDKAVEVIKKEYFL